MTDLKKAFQEGNAQYKVAMEQEAINLRIRCRQQICKLVAENASHGHVRVSDLLINPILEELKDAGFRIEDDPMGEFEPLLSWKSNKEGR